MTQSVAPQFEYSKISMQKLSGTLGAEISGVDLSQPMDDSLFAEILQAFHDNLVIVFRDQDLAPAQQYDFTVRFGPVEPHPLGSRRGLDAKPEVMVLENRPGKLGPRNDFWHSDISFGERPPLGSMLHAIEITQGCGDTMFCNMYSAYEDLTEGMRQTLDTLTAQHSAEKLTQEIPNRLSVDIAPPSVTHPVIRTHPGTGRKALYVNPHYTLNFTGWSAQESQPLLEYLAAQATRSENVFRHHWQVGDVVLWDNRCTMHYAVRDYDDTMPRYMHRTTAGGARPV
jgi:taurine dioxygenase